MSFKELLQKAQMRSVGGFDPNLPGYNNFNRIELCIKELSTPSSSLRAQGLQAAIPGASIQPPDLMKGVELFLRKLVEDTLPNTVVKTADLLWNNIVYVPGASDPSLLVPYTDTWNPAALATRDDYIQRACKNIAADIHAGQLKTESLANYPRKITAFAGNIWDDRARILGSPAASDCGNQLTAVTGGVGSTPGKITDARARLFRNWNRYAISSGTISNRGNFDRACINSSLNYKFREIFNDNPFSTPADCFQEYLNKDSVLRTDRGAFFCPNFFGKGVLENPSFSNLGNQLGANILLTTELINALTTMVNPHNNVMAEHHEQYQRSLLFNMIQSEERFKPELDAITNAIIALLPQLKTDSTRLQYTHRLHDNLAAALVNPTYNQNGHNHKFHHFWTWPETVNNIHADEGVDAQKLEYCMWKTGPGAGAADYAQRANISQFNKVCLDHLHTQWNDAAHYQKNPFLGTSAALHTMLQAPAATFTRADTMAFLCMLAWRLWGDQLVPLQQYQFGNRHDRGGAWINMDTFLAPNLYTHSWFGGSRLDHSSDYRAISMSSAGRNTSNVEVVIVRPNIEHFMFGIILGQGGEGLGSTFWGQTELSCYDDSQHGIWGMSYKYHERAMVINERNLIRLWDIGYDGYVGGKDDKCVNWDSMEQFKRDTVDVTKPYRGDSMMVMAFDHSDKDNGKFDLMYQTGFKSNWPSPIVFEDHGGADDDNFTVDYENINIINRKEFRVFNQDIYRNAYKRYLEKMPSFNQLHQLRKNAGQASMEGETSSDSLAFQGTLQVYNAQGIKISETLGSGHHGPDFVGVASLRAGKGYKISGQPTVQRLV